MSRRWLPMTLLMVLVLALPSFADKDKDKGHGKGNGNSHQASHRDQGDDDDRWEHRGNYDYRTFNEREVPPGWSKGKKTGWGNCGLPPGQAKKRGCNTYRYQGRDYYYYRDEQNHIVVRRPSIHIQGGVDVH